MKNTTLSCGKKVAFQLMFHMTVIEIDPFRLDLTYLIIRYNFLD